MVVVLRGPGGSEIRAEVGEIREHAAADGVVFLRLPEWATFIPYRDTGTTSDDGVPVYEYAM